MNRHTYEYSLLLFITDGFEYFRSENKSPFLFFFFKFRGLVALINGPENCCAYAKWLANCCCCCFVKSMYVLLLAWALVSLLSKCVCWLVVAVAKLSCCKTDFCDSNEIFGMI